MMASNTIAVIQDVNIDITKLVQDFFSSKDLSKKSPGKVKNKEYQML